MKSFVVRHPAITYFAATFAISWGGVLAVIVPGGFVATPAQFLALLPFALIAMVAGPSIAAIALTTALGGRPGLRELRGRLLRWRVSARWYAAALLMAPTLMLAVLLALSLVSRDFLPGIVVSDDRTALVLSGVAIALVAGIFEELGWTGFATPILRRQYGMVATGLIVGIVWGAWHWLVAVWALGPAPDAVSVTSYLLDPVLFLAGFRVLMVWVYDRTESVPLAMLMHTNLTGSARILGAADLKGVPLMAFDIVWFAAVCAVAAAAAFRTFPDRLQANQPRRGHASTGRADPVCSRTGHGSR